MDKSPIQVSACVLTCNHVRYIRRCLEGVLAQVGDVIMEIIIGDDCSDDGTSTIVAEIAAAYPELITYIRHDLRIGGSENYLEVLRRARGEFVADLDGDDYWMPGKLKQQVDYLRANPDCAAVYTNTLAITEQGEPIGLFNDAPRMRFDLACLVRRGNFLNTSSMMFRSSLRQTILDIDGPVLDYAIHLRLARSGLLTQLQEPLVGYRVNSIGSMVAQENDLVRALYWAAIMDVPRELVTDDDFAHGIADFFRRVILRAVRMKRWGLLSAWAPQVFDASPYGHIRTLLLVAGSILRIACKTLAGRFRKGPGGRRMKIIYRY
jgi:glycosyltransferase involved in cell wall biosynthesis